ncbi:MAG: hypothetical protein RL020_2054 [Pseudomonadota bacterium]|jgi:hypothetical protein
MFDLIQEREFEFKDWIAHPSAPTLFLLTVGGRRREPV